MISKIKAFLNLQREWDEVVPDDLSFDAIAKNLGHLVQSLAENPEADFTGSGRIYVIRAMDDVDDGEFIVAVEVGNL